MRGAKAIADVIIGPHGLVTAWVFRAVQAMTAGQPNRRVVAVDRSDLISFHAPPRPIFLTNYPAPDLINSIDDGDSNVVYAIEDPLDVLRFQTLELKLTPTESIRAQTSSAVANPAIGRAERVCYVRRDSDRPIGTIIETIAAHLDVQLADDVKADIIDELSAGLGPSALLEEVLAVGDSRYIPPARRFGVRNLDQNDYSALQVLEPMIAMAMGDATRPILWPKEVFCVAAQTDPSELETASADAPDRSNFYFYGPYFHLPPARYRMEALIAFSKDTRNIPFSIEVVGAGILARARILNRRAYNYRGYCEFTNTDPITTLEVRMRDDRLVEQGQIRLLEMTFFKLEDTETTQRDLHRNARL